MNRRTRARDTRERLSEPWLHFRETRAAFQWTSAVCPISRYTFERERERERDVCSWNFFKSKRARRVEFSEEECVSEPPSRASLASLACSKQVSNGNSFRARTMIRRWSAPSSRVYLERGDAGFDSSLSPRSRSRQRV